MILERFNDSHKSCLVQCDKCENQFKRRFGILLESRIKFNNLDLCRKCSSKITANSKPSFFSTYNKSLKGKSYEERYGDNKSNEIREKLSSKSSGENNPNYGGVYSKFEGAIKWTEENLKGKTWEEAFGEEKCQLMKNKVSVKVSGENNGMYGKPSPKGSGNGWKGWYKGIYFASLNELYYLKYLLDNNIKFENGEKRKYKVQYEFMGKKLNYFLDFYLLETNEYIEIKPKKLINSPKNKAKFRAAASLYGDKFKVLTEDDLMQINLDDMYDLYLKKEIVFLKKYDEKFIQYINKHRNEV